MALDSDLFNAHMDDPSALSMLLKGHLWVEHALARAISIALTDATRLELDRMSFSAKIDLVVASGALPSEYESPLRRLNKVRNRSAHVLDFALTDEDIVGLHASLSGLARTAYEKVHRDGDDARESLRKWLHAVLFCVEWMNLQAEYSKVNREALSTYGIVHALEERLGYNPDPEALRIQYGVPAKPTPADVWTSTQRTSSAR